jgi:transposase InsO family protein
MRLSGINQLWVADITYIRLRGEFVYLAVVLDAFSRKVVGWELGRTLAARLAVMALERAVAERKPGPGLVHHSDRGVQYASAEYVGAMRKYQMLPSMSRPANPYDNASCESFMKTLKQEQIYTHKYRDTAELRAHIEQFIDEYYNRQRLHSALGYRTPQEFEAAVPTEAAETGPQVSFFRHEEIYRWKRNREPVLPDSPAHPIDESPAGYSLAGWSPPEPASASPTEQHSGGDKQK